MILIQTYQELYYALKVLQLLKEVDKQLFERLHEQIIDQTGKLIQ